MIAGADPYVPGHGDLAFDVEHYDLALDYKVDSNQLSGRAILHCRATETVERIQLDLHGLRVSKVTVDGVVPRRHQHRAGRLVLQPQVPVQAGEEFTVTVTYSGHPRTVPGADGGAGWEELTDGAIVAAQPDGAPSWFPCNDRVSDKASYRFEVSTPMGYTTVANGILKARRVTASRILWIYEQPEPMAPYLATLQIGRYRTTSFQGSVVPITVHAPAAFASSVDAAMARQPEMLALFTELFGPYPFTAYSVVVTDDVLEIPLESQTLSTFGTNHMTTDWQNQRLIAHELAHQWFGNSLTARTWSDIWLHEGFACYSEWLWSEAAGGRTAHRLATEHWRRLDGSAQDLVLADPTREAMFDDRVYKRGALLLHAIRLTLGDTAFFTLLRDWVQSHRHGSVTTSQFVEHVSTAVVAQETAVRELFDAWLCQPQVPALPAASG